MKIKIIIVMTALIAVGLVLLKRSHHAPPPPWEPTLLSSTTRAAPRLPSPHPQLNEVPVELPSDEPATNLIARLMRGGKRPRLTVDQVEVYLEKSRHKADSLLAAFHATGEKTFLREALKQYPDNPRVNLAALSESDLTPAERRAGLDAFKQSAPDNALAHYLSACDHFKSGQTDQAVQDFNAVTANSGFQDYSLDFIQDAEEAYRTAGYSDADAKVAASQSLAFQHLRDLKQLGKNMTDLANAYQQAGDETSAMSALQMGLLLGQRLDQPSATTLLQKAIGMGIEHSVLGAMNPELPSFDTPGQTVKDQMDKLVQQRKELQALTQQASGLLETLSPQDVASYWDRHKLFGEEAALRWVLTTHGPQ